MPNSIPYVANMRRHAGPSTVLSAVSSSLLWIALVPLIGTNVVAQAPQARSIESSIPIGLESTRDETTGRVVRLQGRTQVAAAITSRSAAVDAVRPLAERWSALFGAGGFAWDLDFVGESGGLYSVRFVPTLDGAKLDGANLQFIVSDSGHLRQVDAFNLAPAPRQVRFDIAPRDAAELARLAPNGATRSAYAQRPVKALVRRAGAIVPAWRVTVIDERSITGRWSVLVDGRTGEALGVRTEVAGSVDGTVDGRTKTVGTPSYGMPSVAPLKSLYVYGRILDSGVLKISSNSCVESHIAITDDGSRLVWSQSCGGDSDIWTSLADGSALTQLTTGAGNNFAPQISADGSTIVFVSDRDGDHELYRMSSTGSGVTQLTSNSASDTSPSLDDAGLTVVFVSNRTGNEELWRLDIGPMTLTQLTTDPGRDYAPALSGDGSTIAYLSDRDGDSEVLLMDAAGGPETGLTFDDFEQGPPAITDDGSFVFFASQALDPIGGGTALGPTSLGGRADVSVQPRTPNWSIWAVHPSSGTMDRMSDSTTSEEHPAVSGNGALLAYVRSEAGGGATLVLQDLATGIEEDLATDVTSARPALSDTGNEGAYASSVLGVGTELYRWSGIISTATTTDAVGAYSLDLPDHGSASVTARLRGQWARIKDVAPASSDLRERTSVATPAAGIDFHFNPTGNLTLPEAQVTAYTSVTAAHDYAAGHLNSRRLMGGTSGPIDQQVRVDVNGPNSIHNAFYVLGGNLIRTFRKRSANEPNTAIKSVLYHEYGHYIDDKFGGAWRVNSTEHPLGTSEGIADAVALLGLNSTTVGTDWSGPGTVLRDYMRDIGAGTPGAENRHYDCTDCGTSAGRHEPHQHGEALANFALRLHENLPMDADELIFGAIALSPGSMQHLVDLVMLLAGRASFCGPGCANDLANNEVLYNAVCRAAGSAGFNCSGRPDAGSVGCVTGRCVGRMAEHHTTGIEWLGSSVSAPDMGCSSGDDNGLALLDYPIGGLPLPFDVTLSVAPEGLGKGRYTRAGGMAQTPVPSHGLYLNAWLYVDDGAGGFTRTHILGTGSDMAAGGDLSVGSGDTVAFDPNLWGGATSNSFMFFVDLPDVETATLAILRLRLDYGEDAGKLSIPGSHGSLDEDCGIARFGEVEDHHFHIFPDAAGF